MIKSWDINILYWDNNEVEDYVAKRDYYYNLIESYKNDVDTVNSRADSEDKERALYDAKERLEIMEQFYSHADW